MDDHEGFKPPQQPGTEGVRIIGAQQAGTPAAGAENAGVAPALPHWTAPATGEVPRIFNDVAPAKPTVDPYDDADDSWGSFTSQSPRWRDSGSDWVAAPDVSDLSDDGPKLGALDTDRPDHSDFLEFDFIDEPVAGSGSGSSAAESVHDATQIAASSKPPDESPSSAPNSGMVRIGDTGRQPAVAIGGPKAAGATGQIRRTDQTHSGPRPTGATGTGKRPTNAGPSRQGAANRPAGGQRPSGSGQRPAQARTNPGGRPQKGADRDLKMAALIGLGMGAIAIAAIKGGPRYGTILVAVVITLCAAEFFNAVRKVGYQPANFLGIAAVAGLPFGVYYRGSQAIVAILAVTIVFSFLWYMIVNSEQPTANIAITLAGVMYIGVLGSFGALILKLQSFDPKVFVPNPGVHVLMMTVIATVAVDVGGLAIGKAVGNSPLAPKISPNKTIEGSFGAAIMCMLVVVFVGKFFHYKPFDSTSVALKFAIVIFAAALIGDLSESLIKRDLGIKDMGTLIPGHGGALDRFDAMLFSLPAAYFIAHTFHMA